MPRKEQRPCDDRNVAWATDKGRFGFQMLEKMGWKEGKGLGANEDGTTEHIKVKKKTDNQGIGTETVTHNKNWLETSVAYESILASLNASYGAKPDTTEEKEKPAEKPKGVVGRPRKVLYSRMLRAKDLANYSSEDKSAIFGGVPYGVAAAAPPQEEKVATTEAVKVQEVGSESEEMEEEKSDKKKKKKSKKSKKSDKEEEKDKGEEEEDKETDTVSGVTTTTSAVSLQDYFKMKMAEMARRRAGGDVSTPQVSVAVESRQPRQAVASTDDEKADKKDKKKRKREEEEEEETTEEPKRDKQNKKRTKKRKQEESDAGKSKKEDEKKQKKKKKSKKGEEEPKKKKVKKSKKKSKKASS